LVSFGALQVVSFDRYYQLKKRYIVFTVFHKPWPYVCGEGNKKNRNCKRIVYLSARQLVN
ncbi:hypothetical protein, partial [uncultured Prevotella sp.]|uniref:hypothetical protein n=1 Tax=uncultured Prevotella sp. TaxID=159272 RepID=UPI00266D2A4C